MVRVEIRVWSGLGVFQVYSWGVGKVRVGVCPDFPH